jgi:proline dehydrogenase
VTLLDRTLVRVLPAVPKPVVQLFSSRYIAGPTLADAVTTVRALNDEGKRATIDVLGEEIGREEAASAIAQEYCDVFAAIEEEQLDSNASVKPTAARPRPLLRSLPRESRADRARGPRELRAHRHGGLVHDLRDPAALP